MFAGNFAIRNYALCNGQLLSIAQNTALFSILGTTYGGNGQTTFALPNLQSRVPVHFGQGTGLSPVQLGEVSGTETVTILSSQMPAHTHTATAATRASNQAGNDSLPDNNFLADANQYSTTQNTAMNPGAVQVTIAPTGGSQPLPIRNPYLGLNFQIALFGIFPSRN